MKVYISLPTDSRGVGRVHKALIQYAPESITIVETPEEADLVVIHVIGRYEHVQAEVQALKEQNKPYAMIQYCLRSTMHPDTVDWFDMWQDAKVVWSYYNLQQLVIDDIGTELTPFNFFYAPLGVDDSVFTIQSWGRPYIIATCSPHALAESVKECWVASQRVGREMFHLGHDLRRPGVKNDTGISDKRLAHYYNQCEFVSGLRRVEGFELPVLEGLLCGARPIVFDKPHYRSWFNEFAVFIPEGSREQVIDSLEQVFKQGTRPITKDEAALVKERFNWQDIISGFWERVLLN